VFAFKVINDAPEIKGELDVIQSVARTEPRNAHIIRVDDFWNEISEEEGTSRTYIKMERCDGTLAEYLVCIREKGEEIQPEELIEIMLHILSGLKHCHDRKVCHRDLKLTNSILPFCPFTNATSFTY
jgi:serine/threonine protein kinase